ncbi:AAA family ATPase [Nocardia sp. NPDC052001]|uniref:helix-turn-helix transcriptional regulator n=1 Tax=Nocardia sp. NPDC052001 TaxID=3154853 RepID=UPI0034299E25
MIDSDDHTLGEPNRRWPRHAAAPPVARSRLTNRLQAALAGRVTSVVAPPGYGKSTLIAQWLETPEPRRPRAVVHTLHERDDDLGRFARHLIEAVERLGADPRRTASLEALAHKEIRDSSREAPEAFLRALRDALDDVPQRSVLILEDAHHLRRENVLALLDYLAEVLPPPMHLLVTSRTSTPLRRAATLRVRGQLTELSPSDLAFTPAEARAYLADQAPSLSERQTESIIERCEGWIAGLHLAGRALAAHQDPEAFLLAFTGRTRDVADFLGHEFLDHRSPEVRDFLLDTAVLDVLSADICQAVTDRADSGAILRELEAEGGFLLALDDEESYRFHTLFGEFLRGELHRTEPDRARKSHLRAADWLADQHRLPEAVDHAVVARDFSRAATLLTEIIDTVDSGWPDSEVEALLAKLPRHVIEREPALAIRMASTALWAGRPAEALLWCERTEELCDDGDFTMQASWLRTVAYWNLGALEQTIIWGERARGVLDEREATSRHRDTLPRLTVLETLAEAYDSIDRFDAALEVLRDGLDRSREGAHPPAFVTLPGKQAAVLSHLGNLEQVREYAELSLSAAAQAGQSDEPAILEARVALGELQCERDDLVGAEREFRIAAAVGPVPDRVPIRARGMLGLARSVFFQGRVGEAFEVLHEVMGIDTRAGLPEFVRHRVAGQQIRLRLMNRDLSGAHGWLSELHRLIGDAPMHRGLQVWFDCEDGADPHLVHETANDLLHNTPQRPLQATLKLHLIIARALRLTGDLDESRQHTRTALELAAPQFMVRTLIEGAGTDCEQLLHDAAADEVHAPFVAAVHAALDRNAALQTGARAARGPQSPPAPIEPLTQTESELIPYLSAELTYAEIAARRFVSVNTVKSQLQAVYRKLGVTSRIAAIERSRALGLVSGARVKV